MGNIFDIFTGTNVLEEVKSPINGKIEVIKSLAFGTYIQVGGLTQSGGVVNHVWSTSLKKVLRSKKVVKNCLILGLGAGGNAGIVRKFWPNVKITGVDLDPEMVKLGKKYLKLNETKVKVEISDALDYVEKLASPKIKDSKPETKFDLLLVDLYVGHEYPKQFEMENFVKRTRTVLAPGGIAVFNRLYYGNKRKLAVKFSNLLESMFGNIEVVYPEANVMYIVRKL